MDKTEITNDCELVNTDQGNSSANCDSSPEQTKECTSSTTVGIEEASCSKADNTT